MHDSAVPSVQPRARQRSRTSSSTAARRVRTGTALERLGERPLERLATRPPRPARRAGRRGSRTRARRSSPPPRPRRRRRPRAPSRPPTRSRRRSAARAGRAAARGPARAAPARSRARAARAAGAPTGGPGRTTTAPWPVSSTIPGAVPARPSEIAPGRQGRLLAHARLEVGVRPVQPLGDLPRDAADLARAAPRRARARGPPPCATSSTVRSSCVGPSPPETRQRSAASPSASAASSSSGRSPTIVIRAGSRPSASAWAARNGPFRSVRSPRTSSLPVTTIAARGRARSGARPGRDDVAGGDDQAARLRAADERRPRPFSRMRTFSGEPM